MNNLTLWPYCLKKALTVTALLLTGFGTLTAFAQNGTYQKKNAGGAYSVISFQKTGAHVKAEIFTWWNTPNAQTGSYYGEGQLNKNTVLLHSDENEPECKVTLGLVQGKIKATFAHCTTDHLTEDFNGLYSKISDAVAGDYVVTVPKAFFYKKADVASKQKAYVLKGDKVTLDMQSIGASTQKWVFVSYSSAGGRQTNGYMQLSDLKRVE